MFDTEIADIGGVVSAIESRQGELGSILATMSARELAAPSRCMGWSRLTIVCHLRFGAEANLRMTTAARKGELVSFYPEGRDHQRPSTLRPAMDEDPHDVVASFMASGTRLGQAWRAMPADEWSTRVDEPPDNPDLGSITLRALALLRLNELEVHGTDLDIAASPWSETFVDSALPMRVDWLASHAANQQEIERNTPGTWVLRALDGPSYSITTNADGLFTSHGSWHQGDVEIAAPKRVLLAFLLGRRPMSDLTVTGDEAKAAAFPKMFPPP